MKRSGSSAGWSARSTSWHLTCRTRTAVLWWRIRRRRRKRSATATFGRSHSLAAYRSRILYDNTKIAVARILGNGERQRTRVFTELQSHYLFEDRFGRPGKGNDKGKVEGLVGYARRNFLVPIPVFESFEALNAHLLDCCRKRMGDRLRGHDETIGERLERDLATFTKPLPFDEKTAN